jgi:cyanate permease
VSQEFTVREALRTRVFWQVLLAANLRNIAYAPVLVHFAPLLVWKGMGPQAAGFAIGLWSLLVIPCSLGVGYLGDRWNKRAMLTVLIAGAASGYLALGLTDHALAPLLFIVLMAPFDSMGVLFQSLLGDLFGRRNFATLRGLVMGIGSLAAAASPVFMGAVFDRTQGYTWALLPYACSLAVSALLYATLPRRVA